jgi:hypothetical protein
MTVLKLTEERRRGAGAIYGVAGWNRPGRRGQSLWQHRYAIAAGTVIQLYGTGFGAYGQPGADGLMPHGEDRDCTGDAAAQVLYAGQARGNRSDCSRSTS